MQINNYHVYFSIAVVIINGFYKSVFLNSSLSLEDSFIIMLSALSICVMATLMNELRKGEKSLGDFKNMSHVIWVGAIGISWISSIAIINRF